MGLMNLFGKTDGDKFVSSSGFAAGTLVHVKGGTKPIEQIRVGDKVLSKSVSEGKQEFKRVHHTFEIPQERIMYVDYQLEPKSSKLFRIITSLKQSFWLNEIGWTAAEQLYKEWKADKLLELKNGEFSKAFRTTDIFKWSTSNWLGTDIYG